LHFLKSNDMRILIPKEIRKKVEDVSKNLDKEKLLSKAKKKEGVKPNVVKERKFSTKLLESQLDDYLNGDLDIPYEQFDKKDEATKKAIEKAKTELFTKYWNNRSDGAFQWISKRTLDFTWPKKGKPNEGAEDDLRDLLCYFAYNQGWKEKLSDLGITEDDLIEQTLIAKDAKETEDAITLLKKKGYTTKHITNLLKNQQDSVFLEKQETAIKKYFRYLEIVCGTINLEYEGNEVPFEDFYIPLAVNNLSDNYTLKEPLSLIIMGEPGSGKSTFLKLLVFLYAFPEKEIKNKPVHNNENMVIFSEPNLFPIYIRCRDIRKIITDPITEIIFNIPKIAQLPDITEQFKLLILEYLQSGNLILLIDSLDEIIETSEKIIFIDNLKIFSNTYPKVSIVITSRETELTVLYRDRFDFLVISKLSDSKIEQIVLNWNKAVVGNSEISIKEAKETVEKIIKDPKIHILATNPLLLTTLLLVKSKIGYLPTDKITLYDESINMLVEKWNLKGHGHNKLDYDETVFQLAYIAYWMSKQNLQIINSDDLKACLYSARAMIKIPSDFNSINEFIKSVENRVGLIRKSKVAGYEFAHLSFQEYLTFKAIKNNYLYEDYHSTNLSEIILATLTEGWLNIELIIEFLSKIELEQLIKYLIFEAKTITKKESILFDNVFAEHKISNRYFVIREGISFIFEYKLNIDNSEIDETIITEFKELEEIIEIRKKSILKIIENKGEEYISLKKINSISVLGFLLKKEIEINEKLDEVLELFVKNNLFAFHHINIYEILETKYCNALKNKAIYCFFTEFKEENALDLLYILEAIATVDFKGKFSCTNMNYESFFNLIEKDLLCDDIATKVMAFLLLVKINYSIHNVVYNNKSNVYIEHFFSTPHPSLVLQYSYIGYYFKQTYPDYSFPFEIKIAN